MAQVLLRKINKRYADGYRAVADLNLEVQDGEFMVLVGPSGCGKTTALRMVAGLETITDGELRIGERVMNAVPPRKRDVAMVFQNYALYPHMTVYENLAFPLRAQGVARPEILRQVQSVAELLGLTDMLRRRPGALSGGQRQRVAMGRAIVRRPQVFLMDEPLSNLDAKLRARMRFEVANLQRELGVTTIYVTHDQVEAMTMGHRIAVLRRGVLQQVGPPEELYDQPKNLFVATFIGSPSMNLVTARVEQKLGELTCFIRDQALKIPEAAVAAHPGLAGYIGRDIALGIRPEHLLEHTPDPTRSQLKGQIVSVEALGSERLVHVEIAGSPVMTDEVLEVAGDADDSAVQRLRDDLTKQRVQVVARFSHSSRPQLGLAADISVNLNHAHFFDPVSGMAIH